MHLPAPRFSWWNVVTIFTLGITVLSALAFQFELMALALFASIGCFILADPAPTSEDISDDDKGLF